VRQELQCAQSDGSAKLEMEHPAKGKMQLSAHVGVLPGLENRLIP
jgi:hypothetical protein